MQNQFIIWEKQRTGCAGISKVTDTAYQPVFLKKMFSG